MKTYHVKRIAGEEEIHACEPFEITTCQWKARQPAPKTGGYMGYIPGKGLYIEMTSEETNRITRHLKDREMVCEDSAMEVFLAFTEDESRPESADVHYLNFEINAAGAMYAKEGKGRQNRNFLPDEVYKAAHVETAADEKGWKLRFYIPEECVKALCGRNPFAPGAVFYCNFYKIAENPEIEHYGAFNQIENEFPDFHRPQDFAKAVMEE